MMLSIFCFSKLILCYFYVIHFPKLLKLYIWGIIVYYYHTPLCGLSVLQLYAFSPNYSTVRLDLYSVVFQAKYKYKWSQESAKGWTMLNKILPGCIPFFSFSSLLVLHNSFSKALFFWVQGHYGGWAILTIFQGPSAKEVIRSTFAFLLYFLLNMQVD